MRNVKAVLAVLAVAVAVPAALPAAGAVYPDVISLPNGWRPEGIAVGKGHEFYAGSLGTGAVYKGDLRTGEGGVLVPPQNGRMAVGLKVDNRGRIFVAGGGAGKAYVYGPDGSGLASYDLTGGPAFINDVVVTRTAAWFTNSFAPELYRIPIGPGGRLASTVETVPLTGDYQHVPNEFNANGIDATPDGKTLVIVQSFTGKLFTVDPASGNADEIDLGGGNVASGDGILLHGKTLYVVQNFLNRIAVVALASDLASGRVVRTITDADFDIPTTVARFGSTLYAVNARFLTDPKPETAYQVVAVPTG